MYGKIGMLHCWICHIMRSINQDDDPAIKMLTSGVAKELMTCYV